MDDKRTEIRQMSIISGLSTFGKNEFVGDFCHVDHYKKLKVAAVSDVILQVSLEWSPDGLEPVPGIRPFISSYRIPSEMWKIDFFKVFLPYCRIRVTNASGSKNNYLNLFVYPVGVNKSYKEEEKVIQPQMKQEEKNEEKIKKKLFFSRGQSPGPNRSVKVEDKVEKKDSNLPMVDYRLPQFVPRNSILTGDKNGRISCHPVGQPGEYLMVDSDGQVAWMLPYNFKKSEALGEINKIKDIK